MRHITRKVDSGMQWDKKRIELHQTSHFELQNTGLWDRPKNAGYVVGHRNRDNQFATHRVMEPVICPFFGVTWAEDLTEDLIGRDVTDRWTVLLFPLAYPFIISVNIGRRHCAIAIHSILVFVFANKYSGHYESRIMRIRSVCKQINKCSVK